MHAGELDEAEFFRSIARSGARVMLIGRRIDDLILTKRWSMRDKDVTDIRLLEELKLRRGG